MKAKKYIQLASFFFLFCLISSASLWAQTASFFEIKGSQETLPGSLVSKTKDGLTLSQNPYDLNLYGVIATEAPVIVLNKPSSTSKPIIYYGETLVRVTNKNGDIDMGDFITSSEIPGVGQKATKSGYVIGKALEPLKKSEGLIRVFVNVQYANISPNEEKFNLRAAYKNIIEELSKPENVPNVLRYIFGGLIGITSFILGFVYFGKTLRKGVEGISRNPLAKRVILVAMIWNLAGVVILSLAGLGLSLFVILY